MAHWWLKPDSKCTQWKLISKLYHKLILALCNLPLKPNILYYFDLVFTGCDMWPMVFMAPGVHGYLWCITAVKVLMKNSIIQLFPNIIWEVWWVCLWGSRVANEPLVGLALSRRAEYAPWGCSKFSHWQQGKLSATHRWCCHWTHGWLKENLGPTFHQPLTDMPRQNSRFPQQFMANFSPNPPHHWQQCLTTPSQSKSPVAGGVQRRSLSPFWARTSLVPSHLWPSFVSTNYISLKHPPS